MIPQCLVTDRIPIKLQLKGKSRLIFEFYSVPALRAHVRLQNMSEETQTPYSVSTIYSTVRNSHVS